MRVLLGSQLAHAEPFQAKRIHSSQCIVDATLLLVFRGLALRRVPIQIQSSWNLTATILWFVQESSGPEAGDNFIAQLARAVSLSGLCDSGIFKLRRCRDPFRWPATEDN